jgi:hypothetical protein
MKLELLVHELNIGIKFFDRVLGLYCSFHSALPNEKVIEFWTEPGRCHNLGEKVLAVLTESRYQHKTSTNGR